MQCLAACAGKIVRYIFSTINEASLAARLKIAVQNIAVKNRTYFTTANARTLTKYIGPKGGDVLAVEVQCIRAEIAHKKDVFFFQTQKE